MSNEGTAIVRSWQQWDFDMEEVHRNAIKLRDEMNNVIELTEKLIMQAQEKNHDPAS